MKYLNRIAERFAPVEPLPAGIYHLQTTWNDTAVRLHLRLNDDRSGLLIVNASSVLQLNPTAAEYAFHLVQDVSAEEAARHIAARYRVDRETALSDFKDFAARIQTLVTTPDLDPVTYLDFERSNPHSADLASPLRLDCALTYRLNPDTSAEYAPTKRVDRELTTEEWITILQKAWAFGIPQITFTGGEATLREDLPQLIAAAESNGQVCGLLTDGLKLRDKQYTADLLQTGLDHILFLLQLENPTSWDALESVLAEDIFVTVHITLNPGNIVQASEGLERLAGLNVKSLSLTTSDPSLTDAFETVRNRAAEAGLTLRFDLPVPYSAHHPVAYETAEDAVPDGAGKAWLYVEPDGDVLPSQGMPYKILGNLLTDSWSEIFPPRT